MLRTQGLAMMAKLKRLNRDSYFYSRDVKLKMADAQALSEKQHLELQNLLYEKAKLEEEIRKYQKREYLYTSVDMYSLEEFKQRAPSELQTATDEHTLMLNRLEFELRERTRLKEIRDKLIQRRDELIQENKARNEELRKIDTQFEAFVKVSNLLVCLSYTEMNSTIFPIVGRTCHEKPWYASRRTTRTGYIKGNGCGDR
jgi:THO complex subunit 5